MGGTKRIWDSLQSHKHNEFLRLVLSRAPLPLLPMKMMRKVSDYGDRRGSSVPKFGQSTWLFITHWTDYVAVIWNMTFARIGEDWIFLAMLGIIMALLSYIMDRVIYYCTKTRLFLFESSGDHLAMQYFAWTTTSISLILFATGFVHLVAPQAIGSGIPEIKTILRGVVLKEYVLRTNLFHSEQISFLSFLFLQLSVASPLLFFHFVSFLLVRGFLKCWKICQRTF